MTFGYDILRSASSEPISVTGVSLVDAEDVQVQEALVVPLLGASSVGIHSTYPPAALDLERLGLAASWAGRRAVAGEPVPVDTSRPQELVLGLRATGPHGVASGIRVAYTSGGEEHVLTTSTSLELVAGTCSSVGGAVSPSTRSQRRPHRATDARPDPGRAPDPAARGGTRSATAADGRT